MQKVFMTGQQQPNGDATGETVQPRRSLVSRVFRWIRLPLLAYCVVLLLVAVFQRKLIYHPARAGSIDTRDASFAPGQVRDVTVTTADGLELRGWHVLPDELPAGRDTGLTQSGGGEADGMDRAAAAFAGAKVVVLYFSGNGGHRAYREPEMRLLTDLGADVVLFDYRGYGDNPGSPSAADIARDVRTEWDWLTGPQGVPPERVVLYGESLGGGVAVRLAAEVCRAGTPPGGLILRSTFSSLASVGSRHFPWVPVRWLLQERFPSDRLLPDVTCPLLLIHGTADEIVPIEEGRALYLAAPTTSASGQKPDLVELPGVRHNGVARTAGPQLQGAVRQFLVRAGLLRQILPDDLEQR